MINGTVNVDIKATLKAKLGNTVKEYFKESLHKTVTLQLQAKTTEPDVQNALTEIWDYYIFENMGTCMQVLTDNMIDSIVEVMSSEVGYYPYPGGIQSPLPVPLEVIPK